MYGGGGGMYGGGGYGGMGYGGMGYGGTGYGAQPYTQFELRSALLPADPLRRTSVGCRSGRGRPRRHGVDGHISGNAVHAGQSHCPQYPHVIPNPFDNTLLVQGTPQDWEQIRNLLRQLDVPPRQVLIDAKIYEVDLTGAFSAGVEAYLDKDNEHAGRYRRVLNAPSNGGGLTLSAGALVGRSQRTSGRADIAAETRSHSQDHLPPSIIATDSIPAMMNVGEDVPVLSSSGVAGDRQFVQFRKQPHHGRDAGHHGAGEFERRRHDGDQSAGQRAAIATPPAVSTRLRSRIAPSARR